MNWFFQILCLGGLLFLIQGCSGKEDFKSGKKMVSPDGNVTVAFTLREGAPYYKISFHDKIVIDDSKMGFQLKDAPPLNDRFEVVDAKETHFDETWEPVWGTTNEIRNQYNQLEVFLKETVSPHRKLNLVFRAYNDGVGFRYIFPEQDGLKDFEIMSEETQFNFVDDHSVWWIPADYDSYEHLYKNTPISQLKAVNTPVTMKTKDGFYVSIHEADLTDYAGMTLRKSDLSPYSLQCELVPWPDGVKVKASAPHRSPWRTIQLGEKSGDLIESDLIVNLNEPCVLEDVSWIEPMKYVGIWWGMHIRKYTWHAGPKHGATTENAKRYIDFASQYNIPGVLIEGWNKGWETWLKEKNVPSFTQSYPDFDLKEVVDYAKEKGVKLIGHHETGGNVPNYEKQIDDAFNLYEKLGIHTVKTGYAGNMVPKGQHHHGQWMVNHYREVVKKAAHHKIMINAHEPIKPTGIRRTYPNMITREGARGMEYNAWSDGNPPDHTTILPFTRFLAGPMDYTPGIFDIQFDPDNKHRVYTTLAKQLALYVVLYSPLQMASDLVENYENQPAFEFIQKVPVDWDETRAINGEIGDYITIARRKGDHWYIGAITDENTRLLEIPCDFLEADQEYIAQIFSDAEGADWEDNPTAIEISKYLVHKGDQLSTALAKGGGMAIHIYPSGEEDVKSLPSMKDLSEKSTKKMKSFR